MPHASNCMTKTCQGCGPDSDISKIKDKLNLELKNNTNLLEELSGARKELAVAKRRIGELEDQVEELKNL